MTTRPTPLVIFARLIAEKKGIQLPEFPPEEEAEAVRRFLGRLRLSPREREVKNYLLSAASGKHTRGTGAGSLKNFLWFLRDHAGDLYKGLAALLLRRILEDPDLPLHEGLAERLTQHSILGYWARQILEGIPRDQLARNLVWERIGRFLVAFNATPRNLASIAFRNGADLYVASSEVGSVVMAPQHPDPSRAIIAPDVLDDIVRLAGGRWESPYTNLRVCRKGCPSLERLHEAVHAVLEGDVRGEAVRG